MSRIKGHDTKPEKTIRKILKKMGLGIKKYDKNLPGNPDIVLKDKKKVIFVHGCFWHGHRRCLRSRRPSTNRLFWNKKINGNIKRDQKVLRKLRGLGWKYLIVWECRMKDNAKLEVILLKFTGQKSRGNP